jgi:2-dehydropantoate 2-reductase
MTESIRKVAVVGVGAVGGYFGGRLSRTSVETHFLARGATCAALLQNGLRIESPLGDLSIAPAELRVKDDPGAIGPVDAVMIAVKAWQVREVAATLQPLLAARTVILPLQNGVDAPVELRAALPGTEILGGLCRIMAQATAPGVIRHFGAAPEILLGPLSSAAAERAEALREALANAGVRAEIPPDITCAMWEKLAFIATFGGIGAVTRMPLGAVRGCEESMRLLVRALDEVIAVGRAHGAAFSATLRESILAYLAALPENGTASLQRDIAAGRPSELEALVGAVVRYGQAAAVPTPVFQFLYASLLPAERAARAR